MEAMTIMWRTTSDELPILVRAIEHELQRMEERAAVSDGHMAVELLEADYNPLIKIYHQLLRHL